MDLKKITDEELNNELLRRKYEKDLAAYNKRKQEAEQVLNGVDLLLGMAVQHERDRGCDDNSHWAGACKDGIVGDKPDCTRCTLLDIKESRISEFTLGNAIHLSYIGDQPVPPVATPSQAIGASRRG